MPLSRWSTPTGMVLPERFELSTSPLPRECSTPELRQHDQRLFSVTPMRGKHKLD